jgi:hypothetical protein
MVTFTLMTNLDWSEKLGESNRAYYLTISVAEFVEATMREVASTSSATGSF